MQTFSIYKYFEIYMKSTFLCFNMKTIELIVFSHIPTLKIARVF